MQRFILIVCAFYALSFQNKETPNSKFIAVGQSFQELNRAIREQRIAPDSAQIQFQHIVGQLRELSQNYKTQFKCDSAQIDSIQFVFPVRNYTPQQIGGHGIGYRPNRFNLFDHSIQGSHPAHDIFVFDRNQDSQDDRTKQPIDVLTMHSGIVIATEANWQPESMYRGGNFVWIYDPCLDGLFYYAHHSKVVVEVGQYVVSGEKIAEIGRTGLNAAKPRSSTHLHLMYLQLTPEGLPTPLDTYDWLTEAKLAQ